MAVSRWTLTLVLAMTLQSAPLLGQRAGGTPGVKTPAKTRARVATKAAATRSVIAGTVIDQDALPIADARVRLRNLQTKNIEQTSQTDRKGEFHFVAQPDTPYIVELADNEGHVVAVSEMLTVHTGEVAGTTITAAARPPAVGGLFGNTTAAVLAAVSGLGITTTLGTEAPPVSPEK